MIWFKNTAWCHQKALMTIFLLFLNICESFKRSFLKGRSRQEMDATPTHFIGFFYRIQWGIRGGGSFENLGVHNRDFSSNFVKFCPISKIFFSLKAYEKMLLNIGCAAAHPVHPPPPPLIKVLYYSILSACTSVCLLHSLSVENYILCK